MMSVRVKSESQGLNMPFPACFPPEAASIDKAGARRRVFAACLAINLVAGLYGEAALKRRISPPGCRQFSRSKSGKDSLPRRL